MVITGHCFRRKREPGLFLTEALVAKMNIRFRSIVPEIPKLLENSEMESMKSEAGGGPSPSFPTFVIGNPSYEEVRREEGKEEKTSLPLLTPLRLTIHDFLHSLRREKKRRRKE